MVGADAPGEEAFEAAFEWLLRLRDDLSPETVAAFDAWRSASPAAAAAWGEVSALWTLTGVALVVGDH
jgi:ferric-dicitrate binding protein FerR (iron transport regulator)